MLRYEFFLFLYVWMYLLNFSVPNDKILISKIRFNSFPWAAACLCKQLSQVPICIRYYSGSKRITLPVFRPCVILPHTEFGLSRETYLATTISIHDESRGLVSICTWTSFFWNPVSMLRRNPGYFPEQRTHGNTPEDTASHGDPRWPGPPQLKAAKQTWFTAWARPAKRTTGTNQHCYPKPQNAGSVCCATTEKLKMFLSELNLTRWYFYLAKSQRRLFLSRKILNSPYIKTTTKGRNVTARNMGDGNFSLSFVFCCDESLHFFSIISDPMKVKNIVY